MIEARYRRDYDGEFVITETRIADSRTEQTREWIPNAIENHHISGRAAVIGSRSDQERFRHQRLQRHRGGLLGKKRLQTYGTGDLWQDMAFDFFVTTDRDQAQAMANTGYDTRSTIYTNANICIENPGRFYLVPFIQPIDNLALAVYLAAFDGHQEIFMLGYNIDTRGGTAAWISDVAAVMSAYAATQFVLVGTESNMPEIWRSHHNVISMTYRKFISYCDI
jgi:hypothetical protein